MQLFAVWATDAPHTQAQRLEARPRHRARLRAPEPHPVKVVLAGPTLNDQQPTPEMNGTLLVVEAEDEQAVRRFMEQDPYTLAGVYARIEIRPYLCGLGPLAPQST